MQPNTPNRLPHILIQDTASSERYTSPSSVRKVLKLPPRDREMHGKSLLRQFDQIRKDSITVFSEQRAFGIDAGNGLLLQFESEPGFELKFESLEMIRSGIELRAVQEIDGITYATVFVPEGKLNVLEKKVVDYLEQTTDKGKAKNKGLVESISAIRQAALEALWTDEDTVIPKDDKQIIWWEVWLRAGADPKSNLDFFKRHAERMGISVSPKEVIHFPDRIVIAVRGTKAQLSKSINLLNSIAELRKAKETADFFTGLDARGQMEWIKALQSHLIPPLDNCPMICILDTGINNEHPLLHNYLALSNMHTYNPAWNVTDHEGHGTGMAGLALYGDLTEALSQTGPFEIFHNLESVKIMPPRGENPPHLYGDITAEAIARTEVQNPAKQRIVCMAVSADDTRDQGRPSSWSARIDDLAAGANEEQSKRLIIIAAGNTPLEERHNFPYSNIADFGIHDPGQAWNAITVGAYTAKGSIDHVEYPDWQLVAQPGDLSPSSSTSNTWVRPWPIKPDIVMEGGNMAIDPTAGKADYIDSLGLLTTHYHHVTKPLTITGDTSAATALASRMAARLQMQYPEYWPETIRGLMIHSAEWTDVMLNNFYRRKKRDYENMLRYCGFGVPILERALWSAQNSVSLISQDTLQPFDKKDSQYVTRDLNIHEIPWPVDILQDLGETNVEMRVTLSYFIEPNPARRGWGRKYSYASHGFKFDVKRPLETLGDFKARINRAAWDEETGRPSKSTEDTAWELGSQLRNLGSIHSDTWRGTAAALAERGYIAVYPVIGWWRENPRHGRWSKRARYSLIVTIRTPETNVELYNAVQNMIRQPVEITIS